MLVLNGSESPMPTPMMTVDPDSVTPGFAGFAVIVIVLIAVILLIWDMNRRVRRVRYRAEVREELDAEQSFRNQPTDGDAPGDPDSAVDPEQPPLRE